MIDPKELRIGNYLCDPEQENDGVIQVEEIRGYGKDGKTIGIQFRRASCWSVIEEDCGILPIPLTPEWLERMGFIDKPAAFDNSSNPYWAKNAVILTYAETPPENTYLPGIGFTYNGKHLVSHVKEWIQYVHQLQNLYFSLTGNELEIKTQTP